MAPNSRPGSYNLPLDYRIPSAPPPDATKNLANTFGQIYDAMQQVLRTFVQYCGVGPRNPDDWSILAGSPTTLLSGNLRRFYVTASEAITYGAMVSLFSSAGVLKVRNANATNNTRPCDGYCSTPGGIALGVTGEVILSTGLLGSLVGLVIGQRYYLGTANGALSTVAPVAAGNIEQYLGIAITTTDLYVNTGYWIQH